MVGEKIRLHRSRPCKRERGTTNIDSLPDELLVEILARLSADDLHHRTRVVCRRWRHLIHSDYFIKTQLHRSTRGLLISLFLSQSTFVSATEGGGIETSEIPYDDDTKYYISRGSCNGLVLQLHPRRNHMRLRIINPVTRRQLVLPSFSCAEMIHMGFGIGYAVDSMEYKVVILYMTAPELDRVSLAILSVGKDKSWRHVGGDQDQQYLSLRAMCRIHQLPLVTEGFITWTDLRGAWYLKLDVETEILTVHPSPLPQACLVGTRSFYLSTGRSLSLLVVQKHKRYLMELWEMKAESGEWRKVVGDIKLGAHQRWLQQFSNAGSGFLIMPLGWVRYPEVLALYSYTFDRRSTVIFFNLNTQQISSMELPREGGRADYFAYAHKKSLTWFT